MRLYLKKLRENMKMNKQAAANALGISQNYYHYIENGERQKDLDLSLILNLSNIFDVSVDYIIAEERKLRTTNESKTTESIATDSELM